MRTLETYWLAVVLLLGGLPAGLSQSRLQSPPSAIHRLFIEDQQDRKSMENSAQSPSWQEWERIAARDKQRRERVQALMAAGTLKTGRDYHDAAFIFQHGQTPDDYLLAHILAIAGIATGNQECRWIAAATLDRYLQATKQPQVFGTQYFKANKDTPYTQEPFSPDLLSDATRQVFCVPRLEEQKRVLDRFRKGLAPNIPRECR
jgi:hypothetical protein